VPLGNSVTGRLAALAECPRDWAHRTDHADGFLEIWRDGDAHHWWGSSYAHFVLPEKLVAMGEAGGLEVIETVGLEGLVSYDRSPAPLVRRIRPSVG